MIDLNQAFEEEIYFDYLRDPDLVSPEWREYFDNANGKSVALKPNTNTVNNVQSSISTGIKEDMNTPDEKLVQLSNIANKIAENMQDSLTIPTATSVRTIQVKALDENRRIINKYLLKQRKSKVSFSQILLWAIVKALQKFPQLNDNLAVRDGKYFRVINKEINVGLAVDVEKSDGSRLLMVPNLKNVGTMHFSQFIDNLNELVDRTRKSKIQLEDLEGTTITLTNPGMIGTQLSVPRLMNGQGMIIATGSIDYPVEYSAISPQKLNDFAVSKVVTVTNTYDHRIIQGAESAEFLRYIHELLIGKYHFYDQIFASLKIPFSPLLWENDSSTYQKDRVQVQRDKSTYVMQLINAYRVRGHLLADVNPLGMESYSYPELNLSFYGLNIWDLDRLFPSVDSWNEEYMTLRDIIELMRDTYCGSIGIEYMHIQDYHKKQWIKNTLESTRNNPNLSPDDRIHILNKLIDSEVFEDFLHKKFIGQKRFSLEGAESVVVLMDQILQESANTDLSNIVIGMAHRGRLNILVNNIGKDLESIFNEFEGVLDQTATFGSGDVKYHLGMSSDFTSRQNKKVKIDLAPNPSHLELVNPVVNGMTRAYDDENHDSDYRKGLSILIHGDSAFAGQGIVQETLNLARLDGYKTGGTIHIVINNQIGFTTTPDQARSTFYSTDVAKMSQVPILHVNGFDPEAVAQAAKFAFNYRDKFSEDVIIDLLCVRKYGHNEGDEPSYTQPLMYKKIRSLLSIKDKYGKELVNSKLISSEELEQYHNNTLDKLNHAFNNRSKNANNSTELSPKSKERVSFTDYNTQTDYETLKAIGQAVTMVPEGFNINPKVKAGLKKRKETIFEKKDDIDWATAEILAFGSLLLDKFNIRFTGEDTRRGTFSQRHAVLLDIINENEYIPLNNISENQSKIKIYDSPLSELAVLGFDYGYSVIAKNTLTLWEAQFGDFVNMAQGITDQFISCGETKWGQTSNLVLLLPHGHDGQGPEHSSARPERFLQLCAEENMIVGNFTTPAQYFHALKRQVLFDHKIPLILMTPKSILRHYLAVSTIDELTDGSFQHIIDEIDNIQKEKAERIVLCTGKIYFDLLEARREAKIDNIPIIRVEQLYPFHQDLMREILNNYPKAKEILWVQEEPQNQGAWSFIFPLLIDIIKDKQKLSYIGRKAAAATATGYAKTHKREQEEIVKEALKIK